MTISLSNAGQRFESMLKTLQGFPFPGVVMALDEGSVPSYDFSIPRHIIRVRLNSPVNVGSEVIDPAGQKYVLAEHDIATADGKALYRTHRAFSLNKQVMLQRESTVTDPLTGMAKGTGRVDIGLIWIMDEYVQREEIDLAFRVKEQVRRVVTSADVRLNDIILDMVVRRIDDALGIKLIELQ